MSHAKVHDDILCLKGTVCTERLCCDLHRLLLCRRISAQRMLHTVRKLCQHTVRNIARALGHKVDADTFGADQLHHLLDLLHQNLRCTGKQHMRLIKEEYQLGLVHISGFRQALKQLGHHPQQKARVQRRILHQLNTVQNIHHTLAVSIGTDPVKNIQRGFPEE